MERRIFHKDILTHCYQRTADGGVLFYSYSDHLVHFTRYCITARKYGIQVLGLCQMPDHIHDSVRAGKRQDLERFKQETNAGFSRNWNAHHGLDGSVLESPFGSAPKSGEKKVRSNLVYVGNNPVERKLVEKAEEYRWNYLAYAVSDHPFSEKLVIRNARWPLQKAAREVKARFKEGKPMNHAQLKRLSAPLDREERQQLTDYIISTYNVIDYAAAIRYFGTYDDMLTAMHATTGSEHDLNEVFIGRSDAHYARMTRILMQECRLNDIHEILSFPDDKKYSLFLLLRRKTDAPVKQIAKFLHLSLTKGNILAGGIDRETNT